MKKILVHRAVYLRKKNAKQIEVHGIKVLDVCDSWTASMSLIVDSQTDRYYPEFLPKSSMTSMTFHAFSNEAGVAVVELPWDEVTEDETLEEIVEMVLSQENGWRLMNSCHGHEFLSIEDALSLPLVDSINYAEDVMSETFEPASRSESELLIDRLHDKHVEAMQAKRRDADGVFTWELICREDWYSGHSYEPDSPLHQAFQSGRFTDESGVVKCYEAYLDGWLDAYYRRKKS